MKKHIYILIVFFAFGTFITNAQTFYSITNGNWNTPSTWSGNAVPGVGSSAFVNHELILNASVTQVATYISDGVSLALNLPTDPYDFDAKAGDTLMVMGKFSVRNLIFSNGSIIIVGPNGKISVYGDLTNKNNSDAVTIDGSITVDGNFYNGNGGEVIGVGSIQVDGNFTGTGTTFGYVNNTIPPGSTVFYGALPVELLYFNYTMNNSSVTLNWATASEINNDYFTLEKSINGITYTELDKVAGSGNSNRSTAYLFTDDNPTKGTSYYRLKQTDYDGKYEYIAYLSCVNNTSYTFSYIFTNPIVDNNLKLTIKGESGNYRIDVYDYLGNRILGTSSVYLNDQKTITLPLLNIPTGYYIVAVQAPNGKKISHKLIKE
jgi:hypothetical protein